MEELPNLQNLDLDNNQLDDTEQKPQAKTPREQLSGE